MENAKQAYDAFNRLWGKVPRTVRTDRENHQLMLDIRAFFDIIIETGKRSSIVDLALAAAAKPAATGVLPEDVELSDVDPVRQALRLLRMLSEREWEMVKAIVDLHKFEADDFLDIQDILRDTHCPRCAEWLDDDDTHENCPVPEEGEDEPEEPTSVSGTTEPAERAKSEAVVSPQLTGAESQPKITPRE